MNKKRSPHGLKMKTMNIGLTKKQIYYLDDISKKCKFSGGRKLSRVAIIRALLLSCKCLDINLDEVKSEHELCEKIYLAFKKYR